MRERKQKRVGLLPALNIPLMHPKIAGDLDLADGGIGLRHTEASFLIIHMQRPEGAPEGTLFHLYWHNVIRPIASNFIRPGDENLTEIPFAVSVNDIRDGWADPVYAEVVRGSGNRIETERLRLRVSLFRPGDFDPDIETPGHQGLNYEIPADVVIEGVDDERAREGVEIIIRKWSYMRAFDLICLAWGSQLITHRVQPHEVDTDIPIIVGYQVIKAAGDGDLIPVAYQVEGATGNLPDERARWSAVTRIWVDLVNGLLEPPWMAVPNTGEVIDLTTWGNRDVHIALYVYTTDALAYDLVTLIWRGSGAQDPLPFTLSEVLSRPGTYTFVIPSEKVAAIASGKASVRYVFQGKNKQDRLSKYLHLDIVGKISEWSAPTIDEALAGRLDPTREYATVRFSALENWADDALLEVIFIAQGAGDTIEHRVGRRVDDVPQSPEGDMLFRVYSAELLRFDGHIVEVYYALTQPGEVGRESLRLTVLVGDFKSDMPAPVAKDAVGGQLDPNDIRAFTTVTAPFTETLRGDWINMFWVGANAQIAVKVQVGVSGSTTAHDILRAFIDPNLESKVSVFYSLERAGQTLRYSEVTTLLIVSGLVDLPSPKLLRAVETGEHTSTLPALSGQKGTELVVSYFGMRNKDTIEIEILGAPGVGSPVVPTKKGDEVAGQVGFFISEIVLGANISEADSTMRFRYKVVRDGVSKESETLVVTITAIPQVDLPRAIIHHTPNNGVLYIPLLPSTALTSVSAWPYQYSGQKVWLTYLCAGATPNPYRALAGVAHHSNGVFEYPAPLEWLATCPNGEKVSIEFKVALSSDASEDKALKFSESVYIVEHCLVIQSVFVLGQMARVRGYTRPGLNPLYFARPGGVYMGEGWSHGNGYFDITIGPYTSGDYSIIGTTLKESGYAGSWSNILNFTVL